MSINEMIVLQADCSMWPSHHIAAVKTVVVVLQHTLVRKTLFSNQVSIPQSKSYLKLSRDSSWFTFLKGFIHDKSISTKILR